MQTSSDGSFITTLHYPCPRCMGDVRERGWHAAGEEITVIECKKCKAELSEKEWERSVAFYRDRTFQALARLADRPIVYTEYVEEGRIVCRIEDALVKSHLDASVQSARYGQGEDFYEAAQDYVRRVACRVLVLFDHDERRTVCVPKDLHL